jgi:membrane fusion protein, multidrug efflux system
MQKNPTSSGLPIEENESMESASGQMLAAPPQTTSKPIAELDKTSTNLIHRPTWLYRIVSSILILAAIAGISLGYPYWKPVLDGFIRPSVANKPKPRPPLVSFAVAKSESISQFINCLGTVTAFNVVSVKSRADGELLEVAFTEGQLVEQGQLLARIDPRSYIAARDQVQGQLERDQATLELAKLTYNRLKNMSVRDATSQQEIDERAATVRQSEAIVLVDQAALASAELQLSYTKIEAPIKGRVGLRVLDQGNIVKANDATGIAVITQLQPISVIFSIAQDDIPRVRSRLADAGAVEVLAYDRSFQRLLQTGSLTAVDNQVDASTGTLKLKATFENENESLFPNQFVNIRLLVKEWKDALVIPSSAVQRGPDFAYVYVISTEGDDSKVEIKKVTVSFSDAGRSVIETGLDLEDRVVVEGTDKLQPGGKVTLPGSKPKKP